MGPCGGLFKRGSLFKRSGQKNLRYNRFLGEEPFCMTDAAADLVALADRTLPRAPLLDIQRPSTLNCLKVVQTSFLLKP